MVENPNSSDGSSPGSAMDLPANNQREHPKRDLSQPLRADDNDEMERSTSLTTSAGDDARNSCTASAGGEEPTSSRSIPINLTSQTQCQDRIDPGTVECAPPVELDRCECVRPDLDTIDAGVEVATTVEMTVVAGDFD